MAEHTGRRVTAAALALLASGCSIDPPLPAPPAPPRSSRAAREAEMNAHWQNHPVAEVLQALGPPRLLLDIPGGGNPPGLVLVYPRDTDTGCVDTFAVMYGTPVRVRLYQCR
jgi:hypothetical protein